MLVGFILVILLCLLIWFMLSKHFSQIGQFAKDKTKHFSGQVDEKGKKDNAVEEF